MYKNSQGQLLSGVSLVAILTAGFVPDKSFAQNSETGVESPFVMKEIIVYGGARDERTLLETPNPVSVLDENEIRQRQASSYEELIGDLPGVTIEGGPRSIAQEPNIRGFQDEQVVIRVDGARQNFDLAHRGRFFTDPAILKRVEVLRGGASTLFGSGALGGVIFLDTKDASDVVDPGELWGGEASVGFNSQGDELLATGTLAFDTGTFDGLAFFAGRPQFSDIKDGDGDPIQNSEIDSENGLVKLGWEPGNGHRIEGTYQIYHDSGETPPNANVQGTTTTVVDRSLFYQTAQLGWQWAPDNNDLINLTTLAYYNDSSVEEDRIFDGRLDKTDFQTLGFEATNISNFDLGSVPVAVSYGVEVYQDSQEATRDGAARDQAPDAKRRFYAGFVQADFEVLPGLTVTPGVRYDYYELDPEGSFDSRSEGKPSPRLAVNWQANEHFQLYASGSQSFRAPSLTELYSDGVHFSIPGFPLGPPGAPVFTGVNEFIPTPDLQPERSNQIEVGGRYQFNDFATHGDFLLLSANGYYARVDNFIDQRVSFIDFDTATFNPITGQLEVSGSTTNVNVDAQLYGFEAAMEYDTDFWFASAGLTIPRGEQTNGDPLASIPQDRLVVTGGIRPFEDFEIGIRGTFARGVSENDVPADTIATPGFSVFDIFASWQPSSGPLEGATFLAGIDNFTDRNYRVHPNGLNNPGIAVKVGANIQF
ncbi:TonB-dependent hemoglobin/transferrin/lactoferrin family receptor [Rhodobacteraceae bacterium NNCM2]|nr:TonB-dependent hemoglobin/transferrin/lactoferrin family receptor [Coraliihabitans acroporae]